MIVSLTALALLALDARELETSYLESCRAIGQFDCKLRSTTLYHSGQTIALDLYCAVSNGKLLCMDTAVPADAMRHVAMLKDGAIHRRFVGPDGKSVGMLIQSVECFEDPLVSNMLYDVRYLGSACTSGLISMRSGMPQGIFGEENLKAVSVRTETVETATFPVVTYEWQKKSEPRSVDVWFTEQKPHRIVRTVTSLNRGGQREHVVEIEEKDWDGQRFPVRVSHRHTVDGEVRSEEIVEVLEFRQRPDEDNVVTLDAFGATEGSRFNVFDADCKTVIPNRYADGELVPIPAGELQREARIRSQERFAALNTMAQSDFGADELTSSRPWTMWLLVLSAVILLPVTLVYLKRL